MGLIDALMGNATEININEIRNEFKPILADKERIEKAYKLIRDLYIFTDKRVIHVNKQGLTGKKIDYTSIAYKAITMFSVETSGHFDLDAELKIWVSGRDEPIMWDLKDDTKVVELQQVLATHVLTDGPPANTSPPEKRLSINELQPTDAVFFRV